MPDKPEIQIIDVIKHESFYGVQIFVVIDRMPNFVYSAGEFEKVSGYGGRGRHRGPFGRRPSRPRLIARTASRYLDQ